MRTIALLLLTVEILAVTVARLPEPELPPPEPAPTASSVSQGEELRELLERILSEYDPAAAGTVGALRWADKLLRAWTASGEDPDAAARAAEGLDPEALGERLPRLQRAAETLCSGEDLGLMNQPGRRDWTGVDTQSLFAALSAATELHDREE